MHRWHIDPPACRPRSARLALATFQGGLRIGSLNRCHCAMGWQVLHGMQHMGMLIVHIEWHMIAEPVFAVVSPNFM